MKYLLLVILLMSCFAATSFAQLAKMQFEDAEAAYNEGKFAEAIKLLDEAEASNKSANPPIMHLRILARIELIKQNPDKDFDIIGKARKETDLFLKEYDGNAQLEDKYREVYQASKLLKDLPLTREAFEESLAKKKEAAAEVERVRNGKLQFFHSYSYVNGFKKGLSLEEYRNIHKAKKPAVMTMQNGDKQIYVPSKPNYYIYFRNGEAYGYSTSEYLDDDSKHEAGLRLQAERLAYFTGLFGFEPEAEVQKYVKATSTGTKFRWKNGNTIFFMETMFYYTVNGEYKCSIVHANFDKPD